MPIGCRKLGGTSRPPAPSTSAGPSVRPQNDASRLPATNPKTTRRPAPSNSPSPSAMVQDDGWNVVVRGNRNR